MTDQKNKRCCRKHKPTYKIVFDGGSTLGNDIWLICSKHFNKKPFDEFILKIEELK